MSTRVQIYLGRMDGGLTKDRFVVAVREALVASEVNLSHYAGIVFRIGAATTAAGCGL